MVRFALAGGRVPPAEVARHRGAGAATSRRAQPSGACSRLLGFAVDTRFLASLLAVTALLIAVLPASAAVTAWTAPSYQRVKQDSPAGSASEIAVYAARGEWESFQIVVAGSATNVRITPPAGAPVTIKLYREHYVPVTHGSSTYSTQQNRPEGPGLYPDALIPFDAPGGAVAKAQPYSIPSGKVQPYWVDLFVPRTCPAGQYALPFTVTSDQGSATVTARLTVWTFELPQKPALQTAFAYWPPIRGQLQAELLLLENRIQPTFTDASHSAQLAAAGQSAVHVGFWASLDKSNCTIGRTKPTAADVDEAIADYAPIAPYAYLADEVYTSCDSSTPLENWSEELRGRVKTMVTIAPRVGWEWLDIFVTLPKFDVSADVAAAQDRGSEVWSYNCLSQDGYSPKWLLDYAPINYRIQPGFLNWRRNLTGLLYWRVDYWSGGTGDPWTSGEVYSSSSYPGEGMLVYPGAKIGMASGTVVPSMRLKYLRDGVDDFDYLTLLAASGQSDWAQGVATPIATDWHTWTRDSAALEAARRQLGERLSGAVTPHTLAVTAATSPSTVASGGSAGLAATVTDSLGHGVASWSWSDGGAGGSFAPSATVQNPTYTAAANTTGANRSVSLTVTATCGGSPSITDSASVTLTVQSVAHTLSAAASASPSSVESGGATSLSASASDSLGHAITSWSWSDGGAGGVFSPSASVRTPSYAAAPNTSESVRTVNLSVTATCDGSSPISATSSTTLAVEPITHVVTVSAGVSPSTIPSAGSAGLSASAVDSRGHAIIGWLWSDGGAGGSFTPSTAAQNPTYVAAQNATGESRAVTLTVTAVCSGPTPVSGSATATLTVEPAQHDLSVNAAASPSAVPSGEATSLSATAPDSLGHAISWLWSDGGAGGSFAPSAAVQSPSYTAPDNATEGDQVVTLTVTATCDGSPPLTAVAEVSLTVRPAALTLPVEAGMPIPAVVPSESTADLSATTSDSATDAAASWLWEDGGAQGEFVPSATVREPHYRAPRNTTGRSMRVVLTVTASCSDPLPMIGMDSTEVIVEPLQHTLAVFASAQPTTVSWKGKAQLSAAVQDSLDHAVSSWTWSDNGAGGAFFPSRLVQAPTYRVPANPSSETASVVLSVTAVCDGAEALTAQSYLALYVQPKPKGKVSVTPIGGEPGTESSFSDVTATYWAKGAIEACRRAGIIGGFPDGSYRPALAVGRDQAAVYFSRALAGGDEAVPAGPARASFSDVPTGHWAYRYVEYAKARGVVNGFADGRYRPADPVSRAGMAVFIARSVASPTGDDGLASYQPPEVATFSDVATSHWAYRYVEYVAERGIVNGYLDGSYRPGQACTRAEAAVYLAKAFALAF
ncbi:MAG: S-layer homology domain-containing protein [Armatimonadota bacterium]